MTKRMLIDAAHTDETRIVLLTNDQVYDYDFVTSSKSQIKGNIYLAKITRVEPSLQAAFVEYGGGKQGFLPFSEIHPDYYQLPSNDKQKLLEEQIAEAEAEEAAEDAAFEREQAAREARARNRDAGIETENEEDDAADDDMNTGEQPDDASSSEAIIAFTESSMADSAVIASLPIVPPIEMPQEFATETHMHSDVIPLNAESFAIHSADVSDDHVSSLRAEGEATDLTLIEGQDSAHHDSAHGHDHAHGESDDSEESRDSRGRGNDRSLHRRYRIQEVIKRNQIVLVQVIKEERGNKGASLTTYISLAGRAAVLMPNSPKGGGISRKITDRETRKRLKEVASEMRTHRGMSVIIRTAGIDRTKAEIRRDYEYLVSVWNEVRTTTLSSIAPALIYEEGNLIKRSLRDLYTSDVEEVIVEGEAAYQDAKNFMRMLMPSHVGRVKLYKESMPMFAYAGVEDQLAAMQEPQVRLPSGGYLVIHPTEALISIDVNSGRSTTERNVEETAIKTNMEAAYEVARQLRLRDLAGLIVIDFIDMGISRNRKSVERAMKDALKADRAKIQIGRISMFGLMELSRQRLRPSISEAMGMMCPHCKGTGYIQSVESVGIQIVRMLEKEAASGDYAALRVTTHPETALYLLNEKRTALQSLEQRYNVTVAILMDASMLNGSQRLVKVTADGREILHDTGASSSQANKRGGNRGRRGKRSGNGSGREGNGNVISFDGTVTVDPADLEYAEEMRDGDDEILIRGESAEEVREPREPREPRGNGQRRERGGRNRNRNRRGERGDRPDRAERTPGDIAEQVEGAVTEGAVEGAEGIVTAEGTEGARGERGNRRRGRRGGRNRRDRDRRPREGQAEGAEGFVATEGGHDAAPQSDAAGGEFQPREPRESREPRAPREHREPRPARAPREHSNEDRPAQDRPVHAEAKPSFVIPLSEKQTNPAAVASPIVSEAGDDKSKRKGWWSRVLEN